MPRFLEFLKDGVFCLKFHSHKGFKNLYLEKNRKKAIFLALKLAKKEDLVLVAGKGHEKFQTIKNKKIPFSDREVITEFFAKNGK